jgi:hypothetical protein
MVPEFGKSLEESLKLRTPRMTQYKKAWSAGVLAVRGETRNDVSILLKFISLIYNNIKYKFKNKKGKGKRKIHA